MDYFLVVLVHILCAIIFVGYVFFDACIYPMAKKYCDEESMKKVKKAYARGGAKVFGLAFILLILSGIHLASNYIGGDNGWFTSGFQIILLFKIFLLIFMCLITFISIFWVFVLKKPDPFGKYSHLIGLVLCVIIVVCAKAMVLLNF